MDVCKSDLAFRKHRTVETPRPPLVPSEKNNVLTTSRLRTRDVPSRYNSPSPSTPSGPRLCPSPNLTRTGHTSSQLVQKRSISVDRRRPSTAPSPPSPSKSVHSCSGFPRTALTSSQLVQKRSISVDRRRPSTPPSPQRPSTPVQDSSVDMQLASRRAAGGRMPESLWPSTMRSLSVSFQSDTISIPVSKKEKPANNALSERTLRPSSNVAHKQVETPSTVRKPTPERKRSPLKGKNVANQSENSRPVDGLHTRSVDQRRWPSRIGGKVSSNALSRSVDLADKTARTLAAPVPGSGSLRRTPSSEGIGKTLQKSSSDTARLFFLEDSARAGFGANLADDNPLQACGAHKLVSTILSDRLVSATPVVRSQSLPSGGSRPPSPSRTSMMSSPVTRGISPSRTRPSTPPSRGISPSRIRASTTSNQPTNPNSVLSFIADFKKGKKGSNYIEDAHRLRLLYNRYMQWRFANARSQRVLYFQKVTAERTLFNVWSAILSLWDSVIRKRINLQQLKLELKLNSVLNDQMRYLDDWALLERDHITSLSGAVEDLEASTLRLPVTGGARADIDSLKVAICSAVDVMQAMASSICSLLPRAESINRLVSELATIAAREKSMLDECEALLASTAAMQVEEYSLRTHLIQRKEDLGSLR